ncbi:MAG: hypothetical protein OIF48_05120 [Silicimonas sp.]|nr:hypothetical protein [Silicimonas sp.]
MFALSPRRPLAPVGSFTANFRAVFLGRLVSALSMWLALVVLAKLSDLNTVGLYALAQALCIPVAEIGKMGLRELRSSDPLQTTKFHHYMRLRQVAATLGFLLMVGFALLATDNWQAVLVVTLYAATRCLEMLSDMIYGQFQGEERMGLIGRSLSIVGVLSLLALAVGYWLTQSLALAVLGQLLAYLAVFAFLDLPNARRLAAYTGTTLFGPSSLRQLRKLAIIAMPLTAATGLIIVAQYVPRLVVEASQGLAMLGVFAALLALAMAPDRLVHSLGVAISVRLARHYSQGRIGRFAVILGRLTLGIAFACGLGLGIASLYGEAIIKVVYTVEYAAFAGVFVTLVAAASARLVASALKFGLIASRRFWWITMQNAVAAAVAVVATPVLVAEHGLPGAAGALLAAFSAQMMLALAGVLRVLWSAHRKE